MYRTVLLLLLVASSTVRGQAVSPAPDTLLNAIQIALESFGTGASVSASGSVAKYIYRMPFARECDVKVTARSEHEIRTEDRTVTASLGRLSPDVRVKQWE